MGNPGPGDAGLRSARQRLGLRSSFTAPTPAKPAVNRRAFVAMAAGLGVGGGAQFPSRASATALPAVSYAFDDEFAGPAGSAPDPTKWDHDIGGGGWGNNELEVYTSARRSEEHTSELQS